jgi:threonine/homoserine/homoserine lactone efflux protein
MNLPLLIIMAFVLGFLAAVPVGGSQIEVAKRALNGHLRAALLVAAGSVSSDMLVGLISLFGIAPFLSRPSVTAWFFLGGGLLLAGLAVLTFRESAKPHHLDFDHAQLRRGRLSYATGFSLAFTSPPMVFVWLVGKGIAEKFGVVRAFDAKSSVIFVLAGSLGLVSYLAGLAFVLHRMKRFFSIRLLRRIYFWLGLGLVALSASFIFEALKTLLRR